MQGRKIEEINGKDVLSLVWFLRVKEIEKCLWTEEGFPLPKH